MDIVDRDLEKAETQATRQWSQDRSQERSHSRTREGQARQRHPASAPSRTSSSTSSSVDTSDVRDGLGLSSLATHPTHIDRIETHRLQHSHTVGASTTSRASNRPLPEFGAGKPYPPPLPAREEFVVEFNGPDDPLHPQNWATKKKCATNTEKPALSSNMLIM